MSEPFTGQQAEAVRRRSIVATGAVVASLLLGLAALKGAEWWMGAVIDKPAAPLQKPLAELPEKLPPYESPGRAMDKRLPEEQVEALGTKDYLLRDYTDTRKTQEEVGRELALNLNFYAKGSATPHVPDICWAGAGNVRVEGGVDLFAVAGVKCRDGVERDIVMRMISFMPRGRDPSELALGDDGNRSRLINVAYVFQVNGGKYVATPQAVARDYWDAKARYAYHTKIEVTVKKPCSAAEAQRVIEEFIRTALSEIEGCLPDPQAAEPGGGAAADPQEKPR